MKDNSRCSPNGKRRQDEDRHNFISLCYVASVEGELTLRYARGRKFGEAGVR